MYAWNQRRETGRVENNGYNGDFLLYTHVIG